MEAKNRQRCKMNEPHSWVVQVLPEKDEPVARVHPIESQAAGQFARVAGRVQVDDTLGLVVDHPTALPGTIGQLHIFPVERRHQRLKSSQFLELLAIQCAETAVHMERVAGVPSGVYGIPVGEVIVPKCLPKAPSELANLPA